MKKLTPFLALLIVAVLASSSDAWVVQVPASGGGNPFVLKDHTGAAGITTFTSSPIVATGANFLVVEGSAFFDNVAVTGMALTDSTGGNIGCWATPLITNLNATNYNTFTWVCYGPSVSGSMAFTLAPTGPGPNTSFYGSLCVQAWAGAAGGSVDQQAHSGNTATTTIQAGSITPGHPKELVVAMMSNSALSPTGVTINSSYTKTDDVAAVSGVNIGSACGYFLQTSAGATNPTWTANSISSANEAQIISTQ